MAGDESNYGGKVLWCRGAVPPELDLSPSLDVADRFSAITGPTANLRQAALPTWTSIGKPGTMRTQTLPHIPHSAGTVSQGDKSNYGGKVLWCRGAVPP